MLSGDLSVFILNALILFIALPIHEFAHAWSADFLGDDTPRMYGRLTLNPLDHLDLMGSLMMVVAGFGWAKPVPINPYVLTRRSPAAVMWVSLAGPLSNFAQAVVGAILLRLLIVAGLANNIAGMFLQQYLIVNLGLMIFNLIPLAPLDGDKIADYLMPSSWTRTWEAIRPYGPVILLVLMLVGRTMGIDILGAIMGPPLRALYSLLMGL